MSLEEDVCSEPSRGKGMRRAGDYQRFGTRISGKRVVVADWKKGRKAPGSVGGW